MKYLLGFIGAFCAFADQPKCKIVRLADIGWSDVTATTAFTANQLRNLGYEAKISLLSLPVTLMALKQKDMDVFLGNWMPSQTADIKPYLQEKSLVVVGKNLSGARYTLAVPQYVYDAGVHSFYDLQKYSTKFNQKIYGIEPGNDGNRIIQKMLNDPQMGLLGWKLVESSEQAMLTQVKKAILEKQWIVFLGWEPHPMNLSLKLQYLKEGDAYFGPNYGAASVYTLARVGLKEDCPKLYAFFQNLHFTIQQENELMQNGIQDLTQKNESLFLSPFVWIPLISLTIGVLMGSLSLFFSLLFGLFMIMGLGFWPETTQTFLLVTASVLICSLFGIPIGILAAEYKSLRRFLMPILDLAQTMPTFVYLIPTLMLFGLGMIPGLVSTIIFAIAAPIRLTCLGLLDVPKESIEMAQSFGASYWQTLYKVKLPYAHAQIVEGLSQCVLLSLSMVVMAALVGAEGLGAPVVRALNTVNLEEGFKAGSAIVILAVLMNQSLKHATAGFK